MVVPWFFFWHYAIVRANNVRERREAIDGFGDELRQRLESSRLRLARA